ncbi:TonB-dependent receptor [uncultured Chitinophaga sp.]|uniref:TonB-dependent receptor domain-containing protein n=1 Tax=uncultured Chitinophaga sp. TaxID=339340 RepID=UPI0026167870|nr:TonB-dependent receptor [uncultured Chitinophaga sp.]
MKSLWKIRCTGACLLLAGSAAAQEIPDSNRVRDLREVRIFAPRPVREISPGQTLQGAQLQRLGAQSVADAIRYFSGLQIKDYGGVGGLKTVDVRGMGTNHTAVFYDGIQLGNAQNGQIDLGKFSMDNMQAVSLYNGQKSNTFQPAKDYSASAAIYLTPLRPEFRDGKNYLLKGIVKTGSFSLLNPAVLYHQKLGKRTALSLNTEYVYAGGQYKFRYRKVNGYDTTAMRKNGDVNAFRAEASLHGSMPSGDWSTRVYFYDSERGLPGFVVNGVFGHTDRQWDRNFFWQGQFRKDIAKRYSVLVNAKYANDYTRYVASDPTWLLIDNTYRQQEAYVSVAQQYTIKPWWTAGLSADYQYNLLNASLKNFSYPRRHTVLGALSSSVTLPRFNAQAALLATLMNESVRLNSASGPKRELTPSLVLSWQPVKNEDFRLRGFYKNIFRMPTFNDLYYTEIGNSRLDPEYTIQYDAGFTWNRPRPGKVLENIFLEADAYYNEVTGKIVAMPTVSQFRWTMVNLGFVKIHGLDVRAGATALICNQVRIAARMSYTFQQARDWTDPQDSFYGDQIVYLPRHAGSLIASLDYGDWGLNYSQLYTGERYNAKRNIPENYMQPWYTSDLSLRRVVRVKKTELTLTAQVNNLFNQFYDVVISYPMPGRNYKAVLAVQL